MIRRRFFLALVPWWLAAASALAQTADAPGPVGGAPAALPALQIPAVDELRPLVPRPVKAASALLGLGRQRLALVLGLGTVGDRLVVDQAPRDVQAVASALAAGGFVVMLREDVSGAELRAALAELRSRLQPGGVGFVYVAALGAQLDGVNWLLPRDMPLAGAPAATTLAQQLRRHGVPLAEIVDALMGPPGSPRLLVVDAAYKHPALAVLPQPGLAEQKLPPGVMALFGHGLNAAQEVPAVAPLPSPAPSDPRAIAASRFARVLVGSITTPRISGPQALLSTRRVLFDASQGQDQVWLAGETDDSEELAEATLLDGLIPRTPEEYARQGARLVGDRLTRPSGEQTVAEVLAQPGTTPSGTEAATGADGKARVPPEAARPAAAGGVGQSFATTAGAAGTVAGVAATAATVAAGVTAAQAATAAAGVAGTGVGAAGSVAGNAVALAARLASGDGKEAAREVVRQTVAAPAVAPVVAAASVAALAAAPATTGTDSGTGPHGNGRPAATAPDDRTVRHAEGGERPVYLPRTNNYGYAEGDTYTYRVIDTWKDEVTGSYTTAIEEVLGDGQLLANGHQLQMDAQGRVKSQRHADGGRSEFVPSQDLWWSNPKRGESRDLSFKETFQRADRVRGETEWTGSSSVGRARRIETPAGEFEVLPIQSSGWYHERLANGTRSSGQWRRTVYYSPRLGHPVAIDIEDADRLGKLLRRGRVELMHAQTARGAP